MVNKWLIIEILESLMFDYLSKRNCRFEGCITLDKSTSNELHSLIGNT